HCQPSFHQWRQVLWMERGLPAPTMRLFRGETCIFMPTFVEELARTVRQGAPRECRNGINHLPELGFRLLDLLERISEGFLRPLALNCDARDVRELLDEALMERRGLFGLVVVERERAQDLAARGRDRR